MRTITSRIAIALVFAGLGAAAIAETASGANKGSNTQASGEGCPLNDAAKLNVVLTQLHAANQTEVETGKIAADKAQNQAVKDFANRMVREHTTADQNLSDLVQKQNIQLGKVKATDPVSLSLARAMSEEPKELKDISGAAFDSLYMGGEPMEHEIVLNLVEQGQKSTSNADVKKLLDDAHKMISEHKEEATRINRNFRLQGTAVGGGPASSQETKGVDSSPMSGRVNRADGGIYPPSTTPPDLDQGPQRSR